MLHLNECYFDYIGWQTELTNCTIFILSEGQLPPGYQCNTALSLPFTGLRWKFTMIPATLYSEYVKQGDTRSWLGVRTPGISILNNIGSEMRPMFRLKKICIYRGSEEAALCLRVVLL